MHKPTAAFVASLLIAVCTPSISARELTFEDRVKAQAAIERVYHRHQIGTTKPFDEAVPRKVLEATVRRYLEQSVVLERTWRVAITAEMLDRELERIARDTRSPERLEEIYAALGHDPVLVRECFVRSGLVARLVRGRFASDARIHGDAWRDAERLRDDLATGRINPRADHPKRSLHTIGNASAALGSVRDVGDQLVIEVALPDSNHAGATAVYSIPKIAWAEWWPTASAGLQLESVKVVARESSNLPEPASRHDLTGGLVDDVWERFEGPAGRRFFGSVWTGSLFIVWGGQGFGVMNSGAAYDPLIDAWYPLSSVGAPVARLFHTAVWTGSRMVVWGGYSAQYTAGPYSASAMLADGALYDPDTDSWLPMANAGAPSKRARHSAVWTGSLMLVGGGVDGTESSLDGMYRYNPATNSWTTAPIGVCGEGATLIWTGTRAISWGGCPGYPGYVYDPSNNSWSFVTNSGAPSLRRHHTAVWTGSRMIVWGGVTPSPAADLGDGKAYDPVTNSWTPISNSGAPSPRHVHRAVWTGARMVIWGGKGDRSGGAYDPATDSWSLTPTAGAPLGQFGHAMHWTGDEVVVWGGSVESEYQQFDDHRGDGGRFDPVAATWTAISPGPLAARYGHSAVWTGTRMIVWGGFTEIPDQSAGDGASYDPLIDAWSMLNASQAPTARGDHAAAWTGQEMLIWGVTGQGGAYDPVSDTWRSFSNPGSGSGEARQWFSAVWTGSRWIVWGGSGPPGTGWSFDPDSDTWTPIAAAPFTLESHAAVWTGTEMIVWGTGGGLRYNPLTDSWSSMSIASAPAGNFYATPQRSYMCWTGDEMIVYYQQSQSGRYDPATDRWSPLSLASSPQVDSQSPVVAADGLVFVWRYNSGARYAPRSNTWLPMTTTDAPTGRSHNSAIWTGDRLLVWGGIGGPLSATGGSYLSGPDVDNDGVPNGTDDCPFIADAQQTDGDGDGVGNACDVCPAVSDPLQVDSDSDGLGDVCEPDSDGDGDLNDADNCPLVPNENQADTDADGLGDACDNCVTVQNATQTDFDQDAEGDRCDLNDGLIYFSFAGKTFTLWDQESGYTSWNRYRGSLSVLRATGQYTQTPGSNPLAARDCGLTVTNAVDTVVPSPGAVAFYLVTGVAGVESSLGTNSAGVQRPNTNPCP